MRRAGNLWPRVIGLENLLAAARRAARGKRGQAGVARFLADREPLCLALQRDLETGTYRPGEPTTFTILDPKERLISAAPFRDRVLHHALMAVLEPVFERRMVFESFACRKRKGTHAALAHARGLVRRFGWLLKLDVAKCFDSLDHEVVLGAVARVVKDRRVLAVLETIVRSSGGAAPDGGRVGLPIGNLTSQWLANLVLDGLDHHVKEVLRVPGYVRYMDDFGLFLIASIWKVFTKAGKPGWASIIPLYNLIVLMEIGGVPIWWIFLFFIPIANIIAAFKVGVSVAKAFGKDTGFGVGLTLLGVIFYPILGFGSAQYVGPAR